MRLIESALLLACAAATTSELHAEVDDYIHSAHCKDTYIAKHAPACVSNGQCYPHGTDVANGCTSVNMWKWPNHEVGVNPSPINRIASNGMHTNKKLVWAYTSDITQGEAAEIYNKEGQVSADELLNTPVNQLAFIANVDVENASKWFVPGKNNTEGCSQKQTNDLPFGYKGNNTDGSIQKFQKELGRLHQAGVTLTLTMGSWCTQFPITKEEEWDTAKFNEFVTYFRELRANTFGNNLDGIDFDWEGFCKLECLKGDCSCAWDDSECANLTPEELAAGHTWMTTLANGTQIKQMCWMLPTASTFQVMTGITHYMKKAGFVVTLVPMSVALYTGEDDKSANQVMRNEYVKYRKHTYEGVEVDLLDEAHAILLQWYSGFDAGLCMHSDDPMACACNNVPDADYPNVLNASKDGMIASYWTTSPGIGGNMFPSTFPVRCQACGKNVTLPDGTRGAFPCAPEGEDWFVPYKSPNGTKEEIAAHKAGYENYSKAHPDSVPHWWVKGLEIGSKCPRSIDCPDWRYEGEEDYSRMVKLLKSISKVVDLGKIAIGFETMGGDVQVQMEAWEDPAMPWDTVTNKQVWEEQHYHDKCTQNMTAGNITGAEDQKRCAQPILSQVWGAKFNATDIAGMEAAVRKNLGKDLAGIGIFTVDGVLQVNNGTKRMWADALCTLNETYAIPCHGNNCGCKGSH